MRRSVSCNDPLGGPRRRPPQRAPRSEPRVASSVVCARGASPRSRPRSEPRGASPRSEPEEPAPRSEPETSPAGETTKPASHGEHPTDVSPSVSAQRSGGKLRARRGRRRRRPAEMPAGALPRPGAPVSFSATLGHGTSARYRRAEWSSTGAGAPGPARPATRSTCRRPPPGAQPDAGRELRPGGAPGPAPRSRRAGLGPSDSAAPRSRPGLRSSA